MNDQDVLHKLEELRKVLRRQVEAYKALRAAERAALPARVAKIEAEDAITACGGVYREACADVMSAFEKLDGDGVKS